MSRRSVVRLTVAVPSRKEPGHVCLGIREPRPDELR
jgi:hypothetical protein